MPDKSQKARDLAEEALDTAAEGDAGKARRLAEEAKKLDPDSARDAAREADAEQKQAEKYTRGD